MPVWFKPKRYGYGATPVTWQGWLVLIGFLAGIVCWWVAVFGAESSTEPTFGRFLVWLIGTAILVAGLWIVSKRTTEGRWRWRWNDDAE